MSTWGSFDAATSEDAFLDPLYLCTECGTRKEQAFKACARCGNKEAEKFVFPASVPFEFGLQYSAEIQKHKDAAAEEGREYEGFPITELLPLLPELLGKKRNERLQALDRSVGQNGNLVWGVFNSLLIAYGIREEPKSDEDADPLVKKEKATTSRARSSSTSASSKPTSNATGGAKASTPKGKSRAGAGSSTASKH